MKAFSFLCAALLATTVFAQTPAPAPVVVQAIPAANAPAAQAPAAPGQPNPASAMALKAVMELKAANDELLKRQMATLQQLEEMEKAAEQIKIWSKRG